MQLSLLKLLNLLTLWNLSKLTLPAFATAPSNARRSAGCSPRNQPSEEVQDRAKAVTSQSNAWKPTCETSRVFPEQRMKPTCETKATACLNQQKASNKLSFILTKLVNLIWMQKRKPTSFVIFAGWLSYEIGKNVIRSTLISKPPYVCVYVCVLLNMLEY